MTLPDTTSTNREYSLRCLATQNGGDFSGVASDAVTIVPTEGGDKTVRTTFCPKLSSRNLGFISSPSPRALPSLFFQGLTSAEIALIVICVLIVVIFAALAAFLYCTGRLIGCGIGGGNKKKTNDPSASSKKKAEAEKRLRDIR